MDSFEPGKLFWGVATAGVTLAFFGSQQLPYADASDLMAIGILFAGSIIAMWIAFISTGNSEKLFLVISVLMFMWGGILLGFQVSLAEFVSRANDKRCSTLQSDMLSAHPRVPNGFWKFQALRCNPQGTDDRIFVPPTDRELKAGKPLPWGGYPPNARAFR